MADLGIGIALLAGFLSFLSPCILPVVPGFMAYLSGGKQDNRKKTFFNSLVFVIGFSLVFSILGILLTSVLGSAAYDVRIWLSRIGGAIIIIFALQILGWIKIPFLMKDHKIKVTSKATSYWKSFLFGTAFALGWSPCVGAILGSIFALAASNPNSAFVMLLAYSIGLGIPFLIVGIFTKEAMGWIRKSQVIMKYFNLVVGLLLLILGLLVFFDLLSRISYFFISI